MKIIPFGEKAILINFEQRIDPDINAKVIAMKRGLEVAGLPEITFLIPAYCSLTVGFDSRRISFEKMKIRIEEISEKGRKKENKESRILKIPVCYDPPYSLDIQEVTNQTGQKKEAIIEYHTSHQFRVFMLGFLPGFSYMGKVANQFFTKRRENPRLKIAPGSVGLAGAQTGIYPSEAPGGWQIIGRTPVKIYDPLRENPFLFQAGDFVEFYSISEVEFKAWNDSNFNELSNLSKVNNSLPEVERSRDRGLVLPKRRSRLHSTSQDRFSTSGNEITDQEKNITFRFLKSGLLTSIQDFGRSGHQEFGVPVGGAMDKRAAEIANLLVEKKRNAPVLEITMIVPQIEISGACQIALTGADLSPKLNNRPVKMWETLTISEKSVLSFGRNISGCRSYLAFRGDWNLKAWMGSFSAASTDSKSVTPDSVFGKNDVLEGRGLSPVSKKIFPEKYRFKTDNSLTVNVLKGPEFDLFTKKEIDFFLNNKFKISNNANRMGYRLSQKIKNFKQKKGIISSGIIPGTIQITNAGQPVILMRDAQTTGGYPRIGNVISEDLDRLAQMKPGDEISFEMVSSNS